MHAVLCFHLLASVHSDSKLTQELPDTIVSINEQIFNSDEPEIRQQRCSRLVHFLAFHYNIKFDINSEELEVPVYLLRRALGDIVRLPIIDQKAVFVLKSCLHNVLSNKEPIFIPGLEPIKEYMYDQGLAMSPWLNTNVQVRHFARKLVICQRTCAKLLGNEARAKKHIKKLHELEEKANFRTLLSLSGENHEVYLKGAELVEEDSDRFLSVYLSDMRVTENQVKCYLWVIQEFATSLIDLASSVWSNIAMLEIDRVDTVITAQYNALNSSSSGPIFGKNDKGKQKFQARRKKTNRDMLVEELRLERFSRSTLSEARVASTSQPNYGLMDVDTSVAPTIAVEKRLDKEVILLDYLKLIDLSIDPLDLLKDGEPNGRNNNQWRERVELIAKSSKTGVEPADLAYEYILYDVFSYVRVRAVETSNRRVRIRDIDFEDEQKRYKKQKTDQVMEHEAYRESQKKRQLDVEKSVASFQNMVSEYRRVHGEGNVNEPGRPHAPIPGGFVNISRPVSVTGFPHALVQVLQGIPVSKPLATPPMSNFASMPSGSHPINPIHIDEPQMVQETAHQPQAQSSSHQPQVTQTQQTTDQTRQPAFILPQMPELTIEQQRLLWRQYQNMVRQQSQGLPPPPEE